MRGLATALAALSLCLLTGCTSPSTGTGQASTTNPTTTPSETAKVELKAVTAAEWDAVLAQHKGKVVVVDVWADWCLPCKKKFPDFLALSKKYPGDQAVFLSLTVDEKEAHAAALKFLEKQQATIPNYRYDDKTPWQDQFKLISIPVAYVYGKDGKLAKKFDVNEKEFEYKDVEEELKKQLAAK